MSDSPATEPAPPKKRGGMAMKLAVGITLIAAGGGGAFGAMQTGLIGKHADKKEDNRPKLIRKGEPDPYAPAATGKEGGEAAAMVDGEGGSQYRTSYYSFAEEFTTNLRDSDALLQVSLAASTHRDGRVLMWLGKHELAIRSRILSELADTPELEITTQTGKRSLQKRLTGAINAELTAREGFGGVDDVLFKSFIIQ